KGRAAKAGAPDRSGGARFAARRKDALRGGRGNGKEPEEAGRAGEESGNAVFAEEPDSVHIARGCGDGRADPRTRLQGGELGGPGAAVRSGVDAGAARITSRRGPNHRPHYAGGVCRGGASRAGEGSI